MPQKTTPERIGRYRILRRVGAGGMAEVFLAKSAGAEGIEKLLVVKRILPSFARSTKFLAMFVDEAKVAMRLNHPNIVQVYAFDQVRDQFLLSMEYVDGLDLGRLQSLAERQGVRVPFGISAFIMVEVARGLDYAHNRRDESKAPLEIVHRDVSPQNVLLSYEGSVKVTDFGIAKARLVSEETGIIKGKFGYMSPEQAKGERVDRRSDVYAMGIVLAELVSGRQMYPKRQGLDVLEAVRSGRITLPEEIRSDVPAQLNAIVARATAFRAEDRYPNAREFGASLARYLHDQDRVFDGGSLETFIEGLVPNDKNIAESEPLGTFALGSVDSMFSTEHAEERRERRHVVAVCGVLHGLDDRPMQAGSGATDGQKEIALPIEEGFGDAHSSDGGSEAKDSEDRVPFELANLLASIAFRSDAVLDWDVNPERIAMRVLVGLGRPSVNDPLEAIRLAADSLEATVGLSADTASGISISIGVSRGVVSTVRDGSGRLLRYEPVDGGLRLGDRLAIKAGPGEILVTGAVFRWTHRSFVYEAQPLTVPETGAGSEDSEGSTLPRSSALPTSSTLSTGSAKVSAYRLRGSWSARERTEQLKTTSRDWPFVGRESELRSLQSDFAQTVSLGRSHFLTVLGDLGVGKTALVLESLARLPSRSSVLRYECSFGADAEPFSAVRELVRLACNIDEREKKEAALLQLQERLDTLGTEPTKQRLILEGLRPLFLEGGDADQRLPEDKSRSLIAGVISLLTEMARESPLAVWIDAFQWIDAASLELVRQLRVSRRVPLFVVVSTRPEPGVQNVLEGAPCMRMVELSLDQTHALIRARFPQAQVHGTVLDSIVERAGGNPFFILELLDSLVEQQVLKTVVERGESWVRMVATPAALPTTLEGVVAVRLGQLPEEVRRALSWLAVASPIIDAADLSAVAGKDLKGPIAVLEERGLIERRSRARLQFTKAVVRLVAYESIDREDRARMHRRLAQHIEQSKLDVPGIYLARHLEFGGERARGANAYLRAASEYAGRFAYRAALRSFNKAIELLERHSRESFHAHETCDEILRGLGRPPSDRTRHVDSMLEIAESQKDYSLESIAMGCKARLMLDLGITARAGAVLSRADMAANAAGDRRLRVRALLLRAELHRIEDSVESALQVADLAFAGVVEDPSLVLDRARVQAERARLLLALRKLTEAQQAAAEAVVVGRRTGSDRLQEDALRTLARALSAQGRWEDAIAAALAASAISKTTGTWLSLGNALALIGSVYAHLGEYRRGGAFFERASSVYEAAAEHQPLVESLSRQAEMALDQDEDINRASKYLEKAKGVIERSSEEQRFPWFWLVQARMDQMATRLDEAELAAERSVRGFRESGDLTQQLYASALLAGLRLRVGKGVDAYLLAEHTALGLGMRRHGYSSLATRALLGQFFFGRR
ncbi:MAG: protein kinase [Myxococcota bacterium]